MKKSILITGGAGMIGYYLIPIIQKQSSLHIVVLDNADINNDQQYHKERIGLLNEYDNITYINETTLNFTVLTNIFLHFDFQVIVHLAAKVNVAQSSLNPQQVMHENQTGFLNIVEAVRLFKPDIAVIYASSSSVYGKNNNQISSESDLLQPISAYAMSKYFNEQTAHLYCNSYGLNLVGLRFFTVYGKYNRQDMLFHKILNSIKTQQPLTLYNNGEMLRDFTYCEDIANTIYFFINEAIMNNIRNSHIYNVGKGKNSSIKDVVQLLESYCNKKANIVYTPNIPDYDPTTTLCDNTKLLERIDYNFNFTSLEKGSLEICQWYAQYL